VLVQAEAALNIIIRRRWKACCYLVTEQWHVDWRNA